MVVRWWMLGQSFATGSLGSNNQLATISVQATAASWANFGGSMTIRVFQVNGDSSGGGTPTRRSLIGTWPSSTNASGALVTPSETTVTWFTLGLSGVRLQDHTTYAFTLKTVGTGSNLARMFFEWNGTSGIVLSGDQKLSQDDANQLPNSATHEL